MLAWDFGAPVQTYKSYKAAQFNKKMEKMRQLINSIDSSSLKTDDKELLKKRMKELFQ